MFSFILIKTISWSSVMHIRHSFGPLEDWFDSVEKVEKMVRFSGAAMVRVRCGSGRK